MAEEIPSMRVIDIVTGHHGHPHVTADQDARRMMGIVGEGNYILDTGDKFAITVDNATQITIGTGDAIMCTYSKWGSRHVTIESPVTLSLKPGKQGVKRGCVVCLRAELFTKRGIEKAEIVVLDGEETTSDIKYPNASGAIILDKYLAYMALWRIPIDGITVGKPVPDNDYRILTSISAMKDEIGPNIKAEIDRAKSELTNAKIELANVKNELANVKTRINSLQLRFPRG